MAAADTCYGRGLSRSRVVADRMADLSGSSIVIGHKAIFEPGLNFVSVATGKPLQASLVTHLLTT